MYVYVMYVTAEAIIAKVWEDLLQGDRRRLNTTGSTPERRTMTVVILLPV